MRFQTTPRWLRQSALAVAVAAVVVSASTRRKCQRAGERLYHYSRLSTISLEVLRRSREIVERIPESCERDEIVTEIDDTETRLGTIPQLFGRICKRSGSEKAVAYYISYRLEHAESADEQFSLSLERVFVSKPEPTLAYIRTQPDSVKGLLLNDIVWGFLSNRTYGPTDPYEEDPHRRFNNPADIPKHILNIHNYKRIFFRLHDDMKRLSQRYPKLIGHILEEVRKYLETWGVEY